MIRYVVIDLETTGNSPDKDKIIQIGAVVVEDNKIKEQFSTFVNTDQEIPEFIQELTGINAEMLIDAPNIEEAIQKLLPLLDNSIFVAHNAAFDLGFIQNVLLESGYEAFSGLVIDTIQLAKIIIPMAQSYKLESLSKELEIAHVNPHRADDDARATADLLINLFAEMKKMPIIYLQKLNEIFKYNNPDLSIIIEQFIEAKINNTNIDSDDQYIINNQIVLLKYEEEEIEETEFDIDQSEFSLMFEKDGLLFENFPDFELREAQKKMSKEIWEVFTNDTHLMVEAGTGTGKSLAYLIPSLYFSKVFGEKIVIATHTINLQEQLFQRDIPILSKILPFDFLATVLKGRSNYLCLRKFQIQLSNFSKIADNMDSLIDIAQILTWLTITKSGDVEELNLSISGRRLWNEIKSEVDSCKNRLCPWFRLCYYHRAKQKAQRADIIITNHSLLLTNLKTDNRIFPAYNRLVIDEAHQFEDVATKHLGYDLNQYQFNYFLQRYYKDSKNGFLINIINELNTSKDVENINTANIIKNMILPIIIQLNNEFQIYFNLLGEFVDKNVKNQDINRKTLRIVPKIIDLIEWGTIQGVAENITIKLNEWAKNMEEVNKLLNSSELDENLVADFSSYLKDLNEKIGTFTLWNKANDKNMVYWVETAIHGKRMSSYLYAAPIEIGPYVKECLIDKLDSVVMTSATLSTNNVFNYACKGFGFNPNDSELKSLILPSPFNYKEQTSIFIPRDVPNIQNATQSEYIEYIAQSIAEIAISMNGRTMILFTSHSMLKKTYYLLKDILEPRHIKVLGHGIDSNSRSKLTKNFSQNNQTILLGTNSFWEGVDIPGQALSALVIVRLPFTPPNNPIHEAKNERLKIEGKNSFMELSVPQAVIRFKQGFGRLIRTQKDKGIVVIFDKRIIESRYGKIFINSLPDVNVKFLEFSKIINHTDEWK